MQGSNGEITESFVAHMPEDVLCITHAGHVPIAPFPAEVPLLTEPALASSFISVFKLRNAEGGDVVGYATQVEELHPETDFVAGKLLTRTLWTISLPGRGTITFDEIENQTEGIAKVVMPAIQSGKPWVGEWVSVSTVGPARDGRGVIVGGTGEFYGATGSAQEVTVLRRLDPGADFPFGGLAQLRLFYTLGEPEPEPFMLESLQTESGGPEPHA